MEIKASDLGCSIVSYNLGLFYYGGLADLKQDLDLAKYWLLSASQHIDPESKCYAEPNELLKKLMNITKILQKK